MAIGVTSSIVDFDRKQFDALDRTAGFASSYARLRQRERDPRWISRYLGWTEDGRLKAAIPVYRPRMSSWPDRAYDPRSWGVPADGCSPEAVLLVGGCGDRRTGLHVDAEAKSPCPLGGLVAEVARLAADEDRCLAFPYVHAEARDALAAATGDRIVWAELAREGYVTGLSDPDWEASLPRKVRHTLRRDRRRIADVPVAAGPADGVPWDEVRAWAADLISRQHDAKNDPEPAEFVDFRYADLQENADLDVFAFTARSPRLRGVSTVVVWEDEMEVCEIGLPGDNSEERLAVYVSACFHQPFQYAQGRGIDRIRFGWTSKAPKAARGVVFSPYFGGILGMDDTKQLARSA
jgi:hypothetical protein